MKDPRDTPGEAGLHLPKDLLSHPELGPIANDAAKELAAAPTAKELAAAQARHLGRKSPLNQLLRTLGSRSPQERQTLGQGANTLRRALEEAFEERKKGFDDSTGALSQREGIDITLPGRDFPRGQAHLISQVMEEVADIFTGLGYTLVEGREIETDYYNFTALNTPEDHPARSLHDTFFFTDTLLLRTHTSPVQIRVMESQRPPVYILTMGKCYRRDNDATHTPMFHQFEILAVDEGLSLGDLKGTLEVFVKAYFGPDRQVRLRPHFFPFTEPSVEVDVSCMLCQGSGCRLCKGSGWIEVLGAGMVDPNVFGFVGYNSEHYSGFAAGTGIERIAMLKHGIPDLRLFYENDLRFLEQF